MTMTGSGTGRAAGAGKGGQTPDLHRRHRDDHGLAEGDLPDHLALREDALGHLATADLADTPYRETLQRDLCARLAAGCHAGIDPLRIPGPPARP